jgi:hypothetical protein
MRRLNQQASMPATRINNPDGDGASVKPFLAEVTGDGALGTMIDLGDYTPTRVCVTGDGLIWTVGEVWSEEFKKEPRRNYAVVRAYDSSGRLVGRYVPRSSIAKGLAPNYHAMVADGAAAYISCGSERVDAYLAMGPRGAGNIWAQIVRDTSAETEYVVRNPKGLVMTGFVADREGVAYASFGEMPSQAGGATTGLASLLKLRPRRWFAEPASVFKIDSLSKRPQWAKVAGQTTSSVLLGQDGGYLVTVTRVDKDKVALQWVK